MKALASVLLIAVSAAAIMISDLFLRSQDIPGTDPDTWDLIGTIGIVFGGICYALSMFDDDDEPSKTSKTSKD